MVQANNLVLELGLNLRFYTGLAKGLKLKVRKILGLIRTFVEVIEKKTGRDSAFLPPPPPSILNRVKSFT